MIRDIESSNRRKVRKAARSRAWLNGVEVTQDCYYADDRRGIVRLFRYDGEGRRYVDPRTGDAAREERRGKVRLARG